MNEDRILSILTNVLPDSCPNCDSKKLYGGYATDYDVGVVICEDCGCVIYIKEDLTNENSTKS